LASVTQMLAILCNPQNKHGERGPEKPLTNDQAPVPTAPLSALRSKPPQYSVPKGTACAPVGIGIFIPSFPNKEWPTFEYLDSNYAAILGGPRDKRKAVYRGS
jgi:hypothetical protein